jgi:pimeloyl-ACP methyl ester carboxylesterase
MMTVLEKPIHQQRLEPFVREAGVGPDVVCLHANASSSGQWRALMDRLAPKFHVLAPDSYDAGKSPSWHSNRIICLQDEVTLIEPVLARVHSPLALIGHSYGAAVALIAALANPSRVRALVLYEPTLFSLIDARGASPNDADGIRDVVAVSGAAVDRGNPENAAEIFIDYWMGEGTWSQMSDHRKAAIATSVINVRQWGHALFSEPTALTAISSLAMPVLYMTGGRSTQSALGVARLLIPTLPNVEVVNFKQLGHMGPVTHPEVVNEVIDRFLRRHA